MVPLKTEQVVQILFLVQLHLLEVLVEEEQILELALDLMAVQVVEEYGQQALLYQEIEVLEDQEILHLLVHLKEIMVVLVLMELLLLIILVAEVALVELVETLVQELVVMVELE